MHWVRDRFNVYQQFFTLNHVRRTAEGSGRRIKPVVFVYETVRVKPYQVGNKIKFKILTTVRSTVSVAVKTSVRFRKQNIVVRLVVENIKYFSKFRADESRDYYCYYCRCKCCYVDTNHKTRLGTITTTFDKPLNGSRRSYLQKYYLVQSLNVANEQCGWPKIE